MSHSLLALLWHGDAFAWHEVPLEFGIKCCSFFGWSSRTATWLGMRTWFASSHIIFLAVHPKYVWVQCECFTRRDAILSTPQNVFQSLRSYLLNFISRMPQAKRLFQKKFYYIGSAEGHEYPDLQGGVAARSLILA